MPARRGDLDAVSKAPGGSGFFRCRLCRQVGIAVFFSILLLEGTALFYFSRNFERERLIELERVNFAAIQSLFIGATPAAGRGLLADVMTLTRATDIRGGALYTTNGSFIGVFGEAPETRLYETTGPEGDGRLLADGTRYELVWRFTMAPQSLSMIARLDASQVRAEVAEFFWRILALVVVISVIVTGVTLYILGRSTLAPILLLRQSLFAAGENPAAPEQHKVLPVRDDELGEVFHAFNRMLDRLSVSNREIEQREDALNKLNTELERKVAERTASLSESNKSLRHEINERMQAEKRVQYLAYYDALTDLPNRTLFYDRVNQILTRSRTPPQFAILMIDLDHFKDINDSLGHAIGDVLLKSVGQRLKSCIRATDTVARLGGDEFAINQMDIETPEDAAVLARHIIDVLSEPFFLEGHTIHIQASVGITCSPTDGDSYEHLLKNADMALYRAKEEGQGAYHFFVNEMHTRVERRREIEEDLRKAIDIDGEEFYLLYDPQIDLRSDRLAGFEALMRWRHPVHGDLVPDEFISIAERSGLILPMGEWVLREACIRFKALQEDGLRPIPVAVNFSAIQLKQKNLVERVAAVLSETGLDPEYLDIEITESILMDDFRIINANLNQFKEMGVLLTIDDFGTGYSSFNLIKRFPVDKIKIDKSFVQDLTTQKDNAAIVKATLMLGQSLDLAVIAEGVEREEQEAFLISHGCRLTQGKFYGGPLRGEDLERVFNIIERTQTGGRQREHPPAISLAYDSGKESKKSAK